MYLCLEMFNTFFQNNSHSDLPCCSKGSQYHKSQYLPKGSFTQLVSPFYKICYPICKKVNLFIPWNSLYILQGKHFYVSVTVIKKVSNYTKVTT